MLSFFLGISITLNIVFIIVIIIYLNIKNKSIDKFTYSLLSDEFINKDEVKDFMNDDEIDFSSMFRR